VDEGNTILTNTLKRGKVFPQQHKYISDYVGASSTFISINTLTADFSEIPHNQFRNVLAVENNLFL